MSTIVEKTTERDALITDLDQIVERDDFDPTGADYIAKRDRLEELNKQLAVVAEHKQRVADSDALDKRLHRTETRERASVQVNERPLSLGEAFTRSEIFKDYPGRGTSSRFVHERALPGGLSEFAEMLPAAPMRDVSAPPAPTTLLDLVPAIPVSSNSVDLITWAVAAGAATTVSEKSNKPSIEYNPTAVTKTLSTIAVWTQLTRQLIEDAPAVKAKVDQELVREIRRVAESEAAAALVSATLPTASGTDLLEAIRNAIGDVQAEGYTPNAVLLNPADWAALDIEVYSNTLNGPMIGQRFWGLTPIPHIAQTAGTATVGDFTVGVERYVRSGVNLYITDSHASTFIANVFTLLAESRELTVVTRPAALCEASISGIELS